MPLGIVLSIVSLALLIFNLTSINSVMGIRYIGNPFGQHMVISTEGYIVLWLITIGLFGMGLYIIIDNIQNSYKGTIKKTIDKNCPACAETIKFEAKVCKHCGYKFSEDELAREIEERGKLLAKDEYALEKLDEYKILQIAYDFQHNKDNFSKAKYYLERLLREYPKGEYVEVAKERLTEIKNVRPHLFIQRDEIRDVGPSQSAEISPVTSNPDELGTGSSTAITCPKCQETLSAKAKFCHNCGGAVESPSIPACPQCGETVTPGAQFCGGCGSKLR